MAPRAAIALLAAHALLFAGRPLAAWLAPEARILGALLRRPLLWALLILTALGVVAGYQARHAYDIDLGAPEDQAYAQNFQDRDAEADGGRTFRPAGTYSYLHPARRRGRRALLGQPDAEARAAQPAGDGDH